jgi:hypothetical protein
LARTQLIIQDSFFRWLSVVILRHQVVNALVKSHVVFDSTNILYSVPYSMVMSYSWVTHELLMSFLPGSDWFNSDDVITGGYLRLSIWVYDQSPWRSILYGIWFW